MTLTVGSLCSGYEGISQGLALAGWDIRLAWVAEYDPTPNPDTGCPKPEPQAAQKVLAYRYPGVPNLGDITAVDWATVERVDIVTAGFPCTDLSCAGRRAGMGVGTRSGVWANVAEAIAALRPRLVLIENVAALLSTRANRSTDAADRGVEPGPAGVGDVPGRSVLRALGAVLGDLSEIGFDAEWATVSAASVGAPHRRDRVFVLAWPADAPCIGYGHPWTPSGERVPAAAVADGARPGGFGGLTLLPTPNAALGRGTGFPSEETAQERHDGGKRYLDDVVALLPTPRSSDAKRNHSPSELGRRSPALGALKALLPTPTAGDTTGPGNSGREGGTNLRTEIALLPTPRATDGTNGGPNQRGSSGDLMLPSAVMLLPTPRVTANRTSRGAATRLDSRSSPSLEQAVEISEGRLPREVDNWEEVPHSWQPVAGTDRWGRYAPAIARWEQVLGRPAPDPTEPGTKGQPRLSPRFVEWMQGLPDGWVTDLIRAHDPRLKISRNDALRLLGNGVVSRQCAAAVTHLAAMLPRAAIGVAV